MNKKGFLLTECCVALMAVCLLITCFYDNFAQSVNIGREVLRDLEIYRVERSVVALMKEELIFYVDTAAISGESPGTLISCQETAVKRKIYYYCKSSPEAPYATTLYQKTNVEGKSPGINPLTPPNIEVTEWRVEKLNDKSLLMTIGLKEYKTGREKLFSEVVDLCNGKVL